MKKYKLTYEEQLNRIIRLNKDLKKYSEANSNNFEEAVDAFSSFFIQCYHLADWLKNSGYEEALIYDFIKNSKHLSVCHQLANLQKHQKKRSDQCEYFCGPACFSDFGITTPIIRGYNYFKKKSEFKIFTDRTKPLSSSVLDFCDSCINEWLIFIDNNKN